MELVLTVPWNKPKGKQLKKEHPFQDNKTQESRAKTRSHLQSKPAAQPS